MRKGVGAIDDPRGRLAPLHKAQGPAHIRGAHDLGLQRRPNPKMLQRRVGVAPSGRGLWIGHSEAPPAQGLRQGKAGADRHVQRLAGRRNQHQNVGEQPHPAVRHEQSPLGQIVHPGLVGGEEEVRGRALLDLAGQCGAGGEAQHRNRPHAPCDLGQCIAQACCGEHPRARRRRRSAGRQPGASQQRQRTPP